MKIPRGARRFLLALAVLGTGAGSVLVVRHAALADTCDLDPGQAAVFQEQLDRYRTASGAVGAMATVRHCDAVAGYGSGSTQLAPPAELSADTRFRVGSQTKMLVAAVVLQLVDQGQVGLDESWSTTSPEWYAATAWSRSGSRSGTCCRTGPGSRTTSGSSTATTCSPP